MAVHCRVSPFRATNLVLGLFSLLNLLLQTALAAPIGTPPNGVRILEPGYIPVFCTADDGNVSTYGATYGAYWSETSQAWISAPYCYPRWGFLQASPSQIISAGDTVTVTAMPDDSRMAGFVAIQGGMSWQYPGTLVSGCGTKDMTCTVKIGDEDAPPKEWAWYEFHVSGPGRVFILPPSYAPRCQPEAPCLDTYTNAWSYVGVSPDDECSVGAATLLPGEPLPAKACPILGLTWEMPSKDSQFITSWSTKDGVIPASEVQKKNFLVTLQLKNGSEKMKSCKSNRHYNWTIKYKGKPAKSYTVGTKCIEPVLVDKEGQYTVSVEEINSKTGEPTGREVKNATVTVQDWLIVALGDSNGSGQGTAAEGVPYSFQQCDRGPAAYQSLAAQLIDEADDKTSVTFIHTACSGARTVHLTEKKYLGQEVDPSNPLPPQIKQISDRIGKGKKRREIDAVIMSIGINDLMFGGILGTCLENSSTESDCQSLEVEPYKDPNAGGEPNYRLAKGGETLDVRTKRLVKKLPDLYVPVAESLSAIGVLPKRVFLTGYPEPTTGDDGLTCDSSFGIGFTNSDWVWLGLTGKQLNRKVAATHQAHGWTTVTGIGSLFVKRGVCSSNPLFQTPAGSIYTQGNIFGTFHSKSEGHVLMAGLVKQKICKQMYGNESCTGDARKPQD